MDICFHRLVIELNWFYICFVWCIKPTLQKASNQSYHIILVYERCFTLTIPTVWTKNVLCWKEMRKWLSIWGNRRNAVHFSCLDACYLFVESKWTAQCHFVNISYFLLALTCNWILTLSEIMYLWFPDICQFFCFN